MATKRVYVKSQGLSADAGRNFIPVVSPLLLRLQFQALRLVIRAKCQLSRQL
jgi:hypothetical protein